ncbi:uncharacterized protein [Prorops nasuta]|uniref:uncharacterized protein n=1 Tax=Prorops nasuta TaxID=863751 RepID=UPI0034CFD742
MARLIYECNLEARNESEINSVKPIACTADNYCLYCCCNPQCCLLVQKRPPRHIWEAWYFWLGVALLVVFIISSVSSYIVSNYRHNVQGFPLRRNVSDNGQNDRYGRQGANSNEISISVIPTSDFLPTHRKMFVIASQPGATHMTPVVA